MHADTVGQSIRLLACHCWKFPARAGSASSNYHKWLFKVGLTPVLELPGNLLVEDHGKHGAAELTVDLSHTLFNIAMHVLRGIPPCRAGTGRFFHFVSITPCMYNNLSDYSWKVNLLLILVLTNNAISFFIFIWSILKSENDLGLLSLMFYVKKGKLQLWY